MLVFIGNNTISPTDTTMNKIELCIGKKVNSINPYKTYIIFCNETQHYLGTDYLEFSCEKLPDVFPDNINNFKYVKLICYNSG
jgi:hypothetical protein